MFIVNEINLSEKEAKCLVDAFLPGMDYIDLCEVYESLGYPCVWDGDAAELYHKAYWTIHKAYDFGVCAGRHEMPVDRFVYGETVDPMNPVQLAIEADKAIPADAEHINLYITGLTPATLAIVAVCAKRGITLTAYNYNRETGKYIAQRVLTK